MSALGCSSINLKGRDISMTKGLDEALREARKDKMALMATECMDDLLNMMDQDNASQGARDVVDILAVWSQVLGGTLATIPETKQDSWKAFMKHVERHVEVAFESRWRFLNGKGKY